MNPKYKVVMIIDPSRHTNQAIIGDLPFEEAQAIGRGALWMFYVLQTSLVKDQPTPVIGIVPEGYRLEKED